MNRKIIHFQTDKGDTGGIANYISLLANSRKLSSIKQFVVVKKVNKRCFELYPGEKLIELDLNYNFINFLNKLLTIKNSLEIYSNYFVHAHALRSGLICSFLRILYGKKYLYTNHGLRYRQKKGFNKIIFFIMEIFVLIFSEKYICIRNYDFKFILNLLPKNLFHKKIKIVRLRLSIDHKKQLNLYSKFQEPFQIYGIGSLVKHKNPQKFIHWLNIIKNNNIRFDAFWIGEGPLKNEMIKLTNKININIKWLGHLNKEDVFVHLSKATYLIQTSIFEIYPTVVIESFSCGTPVISSNYYGVKELINCNKGIILKGGKEDEKKLINLFKNKDRYKLMSKSCYDDFQKIHYDHNITAKFYKELYYELIN